MNLICLIAGHDPNVFAYSVEGKRVADCLRCLKRIPARDTAPPVVSCPPTQEAIDGGIAITAGPVIVGKPSRKVAQITEAAMRRVNRARENNNGGAA